VVLGLHRRTLVTKVTTVLLAFRLHRAAKSFNTADSPDANVNGHSANYAARVILESGAAYTVFIITVVAFTLAPSSSQSVDQVTSLSSAVRYIRSPVAAQINRVLKLGHSH
jgi:hypothetical protein